MASTTYHGTSDVARFLGVSNATINAWCNNPPEDFVNPEVKIVSDGNISARGWSSHQMEEMRSWMAKRLKMDQETAEAHWSLVDDFVSEGRRVRRDEVSTDQLMLIQIPGQLAT